MQSAAPPTTDSLADRTRRRIIAHLIPFLFILYLISFLDRVNVSFAALELTRDLHFTNEMFGLGAGIFFIGYFMLEIPGAVIAERWSARKWLARIMVTWGMVAGLTAFIQTPAQFYSIRFVLGLAEAGFFPTVLVYLSHWFRYEDRGKAVAMCMSAIPFSEIIGAPISGLLMRLHWLGWPGWRWMLLLEGIPAIVAGIATIYFLPDQPKDARWLPADERDWITGELEKQRSHLDASHRHSMLSALRHPKVLLLALAYFCLMTSNYGFTMWLPKIIHSVSGSSTFHVTLITAAVFLAEPPVLLLLAWHSDKTRERRWHTAIPVVIGAAAFAFTQTTALPLWGVLGLLCISGAGIHAYRGGFWALPGTFLTGTAAAASMGLINSFGNLGGFAGPFAVGYLSTRTGNYRTGVYYLVASALAGALFTLLIRSRTARQNP